MEFPDLKNFSPGSINGFNAANLSKMKPEDIQEFVMAHKFQVATAVIILVAVVGGAHFFFQRMQEVSALEQEIKTLQDKQAPLESYQKVLKEKEKLFSSLPSGLDEENFLSKLTELARRRSIRISSYSPPQVKEDPLYRKTAVQINCVAPGFKQVMLFLNDIENASFSMRVESWTAKPVDAPAERFTDEDRLSPSIKAYSMELTISSIEVLGNAKNN